MIWTSEPNRRQFLTRLAGAGLALAAPSRLLARAQLSTSPIGLSGQEPLPTRAIPQTGERLPVVGFGSSKAVLEIPDEGPEPVARVIHALLERGGRVVDTSPRTEAIDAEFGRVLQAPDLGDRLFLATKINTPDLETGLAQWRQTRRLFGRETVDLLQIESLRGLEDHWPDLRARKDAGETRYIGLTVSNLRNHEPLEAFIRSEPVDFIHVNYSVMEPQAEDRLLPLAQDLGLGVLINRPFMNGSYFGRVSEHPLPDWAAEFDCASWAQFSLKYILAHPAVTVVLTETTNPEHMTENIDAAFGRTPDAATRRRMRELVRDL